MSGADDLAQLRATRDLARTALVRHATGLKQGLSPKGLQARVRRDVEAKAQAVAREALTVATDSRGVVIGTLALAGLWLARKPLLGALRGWREARRSAKEPGDET